MKRNEMKRNEMIWKENFHFSNLPLPPSPPNPHAFREGGEDGVVEGLAPLERRLPPPESMGVGKEEEHAFVLNSMLEI